MQKLADRFSLTLRKKHFSNFLFKFVPAFGPHAIYLELFENREIVADFFHKNIIFAVIWSSETTKTCYHRRKQ